mmetsp:Transcript_107614/g.240029  ORF Transcript_107614/g.240029 Transcript_107614/m.240029 type:complete len:107 (-) Transcript_107614:67-387(-)
MVGTLPKPRKFQLLGECGGKLEEIWLPAKSRQEIVALSRPTPMFPMVFQASVCHWQTVDAGSDGLRRAYPWPERQQSQSPGRWFPKVFKEVPKDGARKMVSYRYID